MTRRPLIGVVLSGCLVVAMGRTAPAQVANGPAPAPDKPLEPTSPTEMVSPAPSGPGPAGPPRLARATSVSSGLPNFSGSFGAGLNIGNLITGATAKLWASSNVAVEAVAGSGSQGNNFRFRVDMVFSPGQWASGDSQYVLPMYLGVGGAFSYDFASGPNPSTTEAGIVIPIGLSVLVRGNPIELYFEVTPEFTLRSDSPTRGRYTLYLDGSVGARYFF